MGSLDSQIYAMLCRSRAFPGSVLPGSCGMQMPAPHLGCRALALHLLASVMPLLRCDNPLGGSRYVYDAMEASCSLKRQCSRGC